MDYRALFYIVIAGVFCGIFLWFFLQALRLYIQMKFPPKNIVHRYKIQDHNFLLFYELPKDLVDKFFQNQGRDLGPRMRLRDQDGNINYDIEVNGSVGVQEDIWNNFLKEIGEK